MRPLPAMRPFFQSSLQGRKDSSSALPSRPPFILGTCLVACRSSSLFWHHTRSSSLQSPASSFAILPDCTWFPEHAGLPHGVEKRVYHYIGRLESASIYRLYHRHHSEFLRLPEQYVCQRSNWASHASPTLPIGLDCL